MQTLLHELKRRRVFRVAGIYGIVAWVIGQVADVVFPALQLPEWTITFVVALLILGFPVAMFFAWVFDIGPQGIERTEPLAERAAGMPTFERAGYIALLLVAMAVLGYLLFPETEGIDGSQPEPDSSQGTTGVARGFSPSSRRIRARTRSENPVPTRPT